MILMLGLEYKRLVHRFSPPGPCIVNVVQNGDTEWLSSTRQLTPFGGATKAAAGSRRKGARGSRAQKCHTAEPLTADETVLSCRSGSVCRQIPPVDQFWNRRTRLLAAVNRRPRTAKQGASFLSCLSSATAPQGSHSFPSPRYLPSRTIHAIIQTRLFSKPTTS